MVTNVNSSMRNGTNVFVFVLYMYNRYIVVKIKDLIVSVLVQGHTVRKWDFELSPVVKEQYNCVTSLALNIIIPRTMLNHLFGAR